MRKKTMDTVELFMRVGGPRLKAALKRAVSKKEAGAKDLPVPPLYIYYNNAGGVMITSLCFRPGLPGLVLVNLESRQFTGQMIFNTDVEWNDGGTPRSGWIYTLMGPFTPAPMFLPDFATGQDYQAWQSTLPYTPGTEPSGSGDTMPFGRLAVGATQA
jgi:hypothetical protein